MEFDYMSKRVGTMHLQVIAWERTTLMNCPESVSSVRLLNEGMAALVSLGFAALEVKPTGNAGGFIGRFDELLGSRRLVSKMYCCSIQGVPLSSRFRRALCTWRGAQRKAAYRCL